MLSLPVSEIKSLGTRNQSPVNLLLTVTNLKAKPNQSKEGVQHVSFQSHQQLRRHRQFYQQGRRQVKTVLKPMRGLAARLHISTVCGSRVCMANVLGNSASKRADNIQEFRRLVFRLLISSSFEGLTGI